MAFGGGVGSQRDDFGSDVGRIIGASNWPKKSNWGDDGYDLGVCRNCGVGDAGGAGDNSDVDLLLGPSLGEKV